MRMLLLGLAAAAIAATAAMHAGAGDALELPRHERVWEPTDAFPSTELTTTTAATRTSADHGGSSTTVPLQYEHTQGYYGEISLGSPPQRFRMLVSTAMPPTMWIPNFHYGVANRWYNHSRSSTYHANGTAFSMGSLLLGFLSEDVLRIGDLTLARQTFAEVTAISSSWLTPETFPVYDGVLSFGLSVGPGPAQAATPFQALVESGALAQPLFALYLDHERAGASVLTLGATNPRHYRGDLVWTDVVRTNAWTVKLSDIRASGTSVVKLRHMQIWTDLYLLLLGPASEVAALAQLVGASLVNHWYVFDDCDAPRPDIHVAIASASFVFTASDYVMRTSSSSSEGAASAPACTWAIQNQFMGQGGWTAGAAFIEKVYTVFHYGDDLAGRGRRMGFALRA